MIVHQSVDHADRISEIAKRVNESYFPQSVIRALYKGTTFSCA